MEWPTRCWLPVLLVTLVVLERSSHVTGALDFTHYTEGLNESVINDCTQVECRQVPTCVPGAGDAMKDCAGNIYSRSKHCPPNLATVGSIFYSGYLELKFVFCTNDTVKADLTELIDGNCWSDLIVCIAPLEGFSDDKHSIEECKDLKQLLEHCEDDALDHCKELYNKIHDKYFSGLCQQPKTEDDSDETSGGWCSQMFTLLIILNFMLLTFIL